MNETQTWSKISEESSRISPRRLWGADTDKSSGEVWASKKACWWCLAHLGTIALLIYSDVLSFQHYWHSALLGNCGIVLSTSNFYQLFYSQSYLRQPCVLWGTNSLQLRPTVLEKKFISRETWKLPAVSTNSELYFTHDGELVKYLSCK